jgi:hypothetical protein
MKKDLLKEISFIKKLTSKLMNEQFDEVEPDKYDCLKSYLNFAFIPTEYDDEDDIDFSDGSNVTGGGDLGLWNDNKVPSIDDESAFIRFVKYLKSVSSEENALYDDDECTGIYFDDMKPILKELYFQKIEELSNGQNMGDGSNELEIILSIAEQVPQDDYEDAFDWMNAVFSQVEFELDDEDGNLRFEHGDTILDLWQK